MRALAFIFANFVFSSEISATYNVKFGIFGKVGEAKTKLIKYENNATYEIYMDAKTTGLANSLSGDRREYFYSYGTIYKNYLIPKFYTQETRRNKKGKQIISKKNYEFDEISKKIKFLRYKGDDKSLEKTDERILDYYSQNDLLTLFFNFSKIKTTHLHFALVVAGAKDKDGLIEIKIPQDKQKSRLQKELNTKYQPYIVFINQRIFSSKRGELHLALDENGYATKAVLKDVILFGDIVGELKELNFRWFLEFKQYIRN